jgi:hypothetical protein
MAHVRAGVSDNRDELIRGLNAETSAAGCRDAGMPCDRSGHESVGVGVYRFVTCDETRAFLPLRLKFLFSGQFTGGVSHCSYPTPPFGVIAKRMFACSFVPKVTSLRPEPFPVDASDQWSAGQPAHH